VTRNEKTDQIAAIQERFRKANVALVATNKGLSVDQANRLRRRMRDAGGEYKVTKHTLTRRAIDDTRYKDLGRLLRGPQGLVFGYADPVSVAKALVAFVTEVDKLQLDGGAVEGQVIGADGVKALATMPDLPVLRARVAAQVAGPARRVASLTRAPAQRIAGAVAALVKKLEAAES
jgi:large subunit ribosomal protein L10